MLVDHEALLAIAYPDGIPAGEAAHLASLAPDRAEQVARRLAAVLEAERDVRPGLAELAARAGVDRSVFFHLRRQWRERRSLSVLTPFAGTPLRGAVDRGGSKPALPIVRRLVAESPDFVSAGEIARQVVREMREEVSYKTALRLVRLERQKSATDADYLRGNYGRTLLLDISAVDIPISGVETAVAIAAVVMDRSSLLVLGSAAGGSSDMLSLQSLAIRRARQLLADERLDRAMPPDDVNVEFVLADGAAPLTALPSAIDRRGGMDVVTRGPRRFGRRASGLLGGRLGGLRLMPHATATGRPESAALATKRSPVTVGHAAELVDRAVLDHNGPRITALRAAAGSEMALVPDGAMAEVLDGLGQFLEWQ
ncbi:MAG: hypothetical protein V4659_02450 [Pseudomonadota bacterium]